jgi:pimeloyl-ACP methyl ester carboxylesterase
MSRASFDSDGVAIAYLDEGEGEPILLIHGFASNIAMNWVDPGWVRLLVREGFRVIAIDNRGHGASQKLYDSAAYSSATMADDARRLLDHLGIASAYVMGYSMGARITAVLAMQHPRRVRAAILAGLGINMVRGLGNTDEIVAALRADHVRDVSHAVARTFRLFAEQTKSDLKALAACLAASRMPLTAEQLATLNVPVLVAVGTEDIIGGSAVELAALIPGAKALEITGRDHMKAVGDRVYKEGVLAFLREVDTRSR